MCSRQGAHKGSPFISERQNQSSVVTAMRLACQATVGFGRCMKSFGEGPWKVLLQSSARALQRCVLIQLIYDMSISPTLSLTGYSAGRDHGCCGGERCTGS